MWRIEFARPKLKGTCLKSYYFFFFNDAVGCRSLDKVNALCDAERAAAALGPGLRLSKRGIVAHQRQLSHSYGLAGSVLVFVEGRAAASSSPSLALFCACENPRH